MYPASFISCISTRTLTILLAVMVGGLHVPVLNAAEIVFDFETEFDALDWPSGPGNYGGIDGSKMEIDDKVTANGERSLRFFMAAWRLAEHHNTSHWPSFEGRFETKDFSVYDRLVVYVFNNSDADQLFGVHRHSYAPQA